MTRRDNFEAIAKAYYSAYCAQAACLGKKPLSYDQWLDTDKSKAPGFQEDKLNTCPKTEPNKVDDSGSKKLYKDLEDVYQLMRERNLIDPATLEKCLESLKNIEKLSEVAKEVEKERGPAPKAKPFPFPKSLNQDDDNEYNYPRFPRNLCDNKPQENIYVLTPDGHELYGEAAKQWLRESGNDNPFSWFGGSVFNW